MEMSIMQIKAVFVKDGDWWVAWTDDIPGAMTQGRTIEEARENLIDAISEIQKPVDLSLLPEKEVFVETMEI
jgi:predicted RNase H-like HicB family nuclease